MTTAPQIAAFLAPIGMISLGCGRTRAAGHLMCRPCWSEVPRHLQREVHRAWQTWRTDLGDADHMRSYRAASDSAIASVR